ncbi:Deleted in lung and esophageal cancer protein 1 [Blyttiomyces sp. JEL0837]|nr:Deleted in lung and esophageal cancer protein 1 [Blyttiomyces sp. JEL0837]
MAAVGDHRSSDDSLKPRREPDQAIRFPPVSRLGPMSEPRTHHLAPFSAPSGGRNLHRSVGNLAAVANVKPASNLGSNDRLKLSSRAPPPHDSNNFRLNSMARMSRSMNNLSAYNQRNFKMSDPSVSKVVQVQPVLAVPILTMDPQAKVEIKQRELDDAIKKLQKWADTDLVIVAGMVEQKIQEVSSLEEDHGRRTRGSLMDGKLSIPASANKSGERSGTRRTSAAIIAASQASRRPSSVTKEVTFAAKTGSLTDELSRLANSLGFNRSDFVKNASTFVDSQSELSLDELWRITEEAITEESILPNLKQNEELMRFFQQTVSEYRELKFEVDVAMNNLNSAKLELEEFEEQRLLSAQSSIHSLDLPTGSADAGGRTAASHFSPESVALLSDRELYDLGNATAGSFNRIKNIFVNRTKNGIRDRWVPARSFLKGTQKPGVLEIESEDLAELLPKGALEVSHYRPPDPKGPVHVLTEDEVKILSRMRSRVAYLKNPRFPPIPRSDCIPILQENVQALATTKVPEPGAYALRELRSYGGGIVATPEVIFFTDYIPHQSYHKTLTVTNKTPHSARFRINIPPPYSYSEYFSISISSTPHPADGLVAPGMSCQYRIRFQPDSLANFEQLLKLSAELPGQKEGHEIDLRIIAKREPPELTIPDILHCGPCRSGYVACRKWSFKNIGGPGRFLLMTEYDQRDPREIFEYARNNQGPATGSTTFLAENFAQIVEQGPFVITPAFFGLNNGESNELTVMFKARPVRKSGKSSVEPKMSDHDGTTVSEDYLSHSERLDEVILKIACDNCQVLELPIRGLVQKPSVKIVGCTRRDILTEETKAVVIENSCIVFGQQNLKAKSTYGLTIHNNSRLKLPYCWQVVDNPGRKTSEQNGHFSINDSFTFNNAKGYLLPNADASFEFSFCPQEIKKYDVIAKLILPSEDDKVIEDENGGLLVLKHNPDPTLRDYECVLQLFCTGEGLDYNVSVKPQLLIVPGHLVVGKAWSTTISIVNNSVSPVTYEWFLEDIDSRVLDVGISRSNEQLVTNRHPLAFTLELIGRFPGRINGAVICKIAGGVGPTIRVPLEATVEVEPGTLDFGVPCLDFGLLALGTNKVVAVPLVNSTSFPLKWRLSGHSRKDHSSTSKPTGTDPAWHLKTSPSEGEIAPYSTTVIEANYIPLWYQTFRGALTCELIAKSDLNQEISAIVSAIEMRAEVQTPRACITNPINSVSCYQGVPFKWRLVIKNLSKLPTTFTWQRSNLPDCVATFSPKTGNLGPAAEQEVEVEVEIRKLGSYEGLRFDCMVDGMVENRGLISTVLNADCRGLTLRFSISRQMVCKNSNASNMTVGGGNGTSASASKKLGGDVQSFSPKKFPPPNENWVHPPYMFDFGLECPIFEHRTRTLTIRNKSGLTVPFRVWVETYAGTAIADNDESSDDDEDIQATTRDEVFREKGISNTSTAGKDSSKLLLKPVKREKIGFSSQTGRAWIEGIKAVRKTIRQMNRLLKEGRGAAFYPNPSHGILEPWGKVKIHVTSYNNLVGLYNDKIVCDIPGWMREVIPIQLGVEGVPVRFSGAQLVKPKKLALFDRVNFGTRLIQLGKRPDPDVGKFSIKLNSGELSIFPFQTQGSHMDDNLLAEHQYRDSRNVRAPSLIVTALEELDSIATEEYRMPNNIQASPVMVETSPTIISAFKTVSFRISFCPYETGIYQALVVADVGYIQPDGSVTSSPGNVFTMIPPTRISVINREVLKENKSVTSATVGVSEQTDDFNKRRRRVKLLVQGKAIEPKLALEEGSNLIFKVKSTTISPPETEAVFSVSQGNVSVAAEDEQIVVMVPVEPQVDPNPSSTIPPTRASIPIRSTRGSTNNLSSGISTSNPGIPIAESAMGANSISIPVLSSVGTGADVNTVEIQPPKSVEASHSNLAPTTAATITPLTTAKTDRIQQISAPASRAGSGSIRVSTAGGHPVPTGGTPTAVSTPPPPTTAPTLIPQSGNATANVTVPSTVPLTSGSNPGSAGSARLSVPQPSSQPQPQPQSQQSQVQQIPTAQNQITPPQPLAPIPITLLPADHPTQTIKHLRTTFANAALKNNTDATCGFTIIAIPEHRFQVSRIDKSMTPRFKTAATFCAGGSGVLNANTTKETLVMQGPPISPSPRKASLSEDFGGGDGIVNANTNAATPKNTTGIEFSARPESRPVVGGPMTAPTTIVGPTQESRLSTARTAVEGASTIQHVLKPTESIVVSVIHLGDSQLTDEELKGFQDDEELVGDEEAQGTNELGVGGKSGTCVSVVYTGDGEEQDANVKKSQPGTMVAGQLRILFENGTVQKIPIVFEDS